METITANKQGDKFISDVITGTGNDMALHVKLENDGVAVLQRSLDGNEWLDAIILFRDARLFEVTIGSIVEGQKLRLVTTSRPTLIQYIQ